jgi:molybdopterin/thiamine biosynthesis adenylyltransferase
MVDAFGRDTNLFNSVLKQLQNCPLISNVNSLDIEKLVAENPGGIVAFQGQVQVEGEWVTVHVALDQRFPQSLPLIFLVPWNALGFIPHVIEQSGYICYAPQEGLLLDRRNPARIVEEALERAISTLTQGVRGDNRWDFVDEFESYWRRLYGSEEVLSCIEPNGDLREVIAAKLAGGATERYLFLTDNVEAVRTCFDDSDLKSYTRRNALYVPLKEGTFIIPPQPGTFWTVDHVREIVHANLSQKNSRTLEKLARKRKIEEIVVLNLPRPSGGSVLFGIRYVGVENHHPLLQGGTARHQIPLVLDRRDKAYILPRGGANTRLQEKQLALIGCGSVGGFLAMELTRAGVLNLTLIDHDKLAQENTFRHVLGKEAWGMPKVEGLKKEIQSKFPYIRVRTIADSVEKALATGSFEPSEYALIVVALGDDTVSLYLNEVLYTRKNAPPVIFTWLEPYGIGGHALLVDNSDRKGCLECLFTPILGDDESALHNRASFAASGQSFAKDISGCGSLFTPYGASDAVQTAVLASRLATNALLGDVNGSPLLSWKGNDRELSRAGFKLSDRYNLTEEELFEKRYDYYNPRCPVCGVAP